MSLKLIPPGTRKNKVFYIRGTIQGEKIERSTGTTDKAVAERILARIVAESDHTAYAARVITFAYAAQRYIEWRDLSKKDVAWIEDLSVHFGDKPVREIKQSDLVEAAHNLCGGLSPASLNRRVMTPAAAVLHYAATNGWCEWLRVRSFKEPQPKTRFVSYETEQILHKAVKGDHDKELLMLWLFRQGDRISDVLATRYEDCNLENKTIRRYISKTDRTLILPLDDEICERLAARGETGGRIFKRWCRPESVSRWLNRLCDTNGIEFTCHMARHTLGKRLSEAGASLRLIMDKLGHQDASSSLRYQRGDVEGVRTISNRVLANLGKKRGRNA